MTNRIDISALRPRADYPPGDVPPAPGTRADETDLAQRALADARFDAFASGSGAPGTADCNFGKNHDFAACSTEPVPGAVLFRQEKGDVDEVDPKDVHQGRTGDCQLMAPLAALASKPDGRAIIKGMITENRNDKGEISYTVTFHKSESHWFGLGKTTFSEVKITVDASYIHGHSGPREDEGTNEVWPLVIEKAFAQFCGGYAVIHTGGSVARAMEILTGKEATAIRLNSLSDYSSSQLQEDLASGKMVVLQTRKDIGGDDGPNATPEQKALHAEAHQLYGFHAYVVTGTEVVGGKLCVKLHNPWGDREPGLVPFEELHTWFSAVDIGPVK